MLFCYVLLVNDRLYALIFHYISMQEGWLRSFCPHRTGSGSAFLSIDGMEPVVFMTIFFRFQLLGLFSCPFVREGAIDWGLVDVP